MNNKFDSRLPERDGEDAASIRTELPVYAQTTDGARPSSAAPSYRTVEPQASSPSHDPGSKKQSDLSSEQAQLQEALFAAVKSGAYSEVLKYLDLGAPLTSTEPDSRERNTLLHAAAEANNLEIVRLLLDKGIDVNVQNALRNAPLHAAAVAAPSENTALVQLLLKHGAEVDANGSYGSSPLLVAAQENGNVGAVRALLDAGADVRQRYGPDWVTPLHSGALSGDVQIVQLLLDAGADVSAASCKGETPYVYAAVKGHADVMELLVAHGAERQSGRRRVSGYPSPVGFLVSAAREMIPRNPFGRRR